MKKSSFFIMIMNATLFDLCIMADVTARRTKSRSYKGFCGTQIMGSVIARVDMGRYSLKEFRLVECLVRCNKNWPCHSVNIYKNGACELIHYLSFFNEKTHESTMYTSVKDLGMMEFSYSGAFGGHASSYSVDLVQRSWHKAREHCLSIGADLVSIETVEEMVFLKHQQQKDNWLRTLGQMTKHQWFGFWTSGSDEEAEGKWMWKGTGEPVIYTNWFPGSPDDNFNQDYLNIMAASFQWDDTSSHYLHFAICEKLCQ